MTLLSYVGEGILILNKLKQFFLASQSLLVELSVLAPMFSLPMCDLLRHLFCAQSPNVASPCAI